MKSILEYVEQKTICRKKLILSYFDEFQEKNVINVMFGEVKK